MQVRDVMTREVISVGPGASAKYAAELMTGNGCAAVPVVDSDHRLLGVVTEADVLRDRVPEDPRLHLRRDAPTRDVVLPLLVCDVMTTAVITAEPATDLADLARTFVDRHLRSVPVVEDGIVVGVVSRRDVLRTLVRPDADIRSDVLRLVEGYTGDLGCWDVEVTEGVTSIRRTKGAPQVSRAVEEFALQRLVDTVPGVVAAHILPTVAAPHADARA